MVSSGYGKVAGNGLVVLNKDGIFIVGGDEFTGRGKISAKGVLGNRDLSLVGSHIILDESVGVEESIGNIDGNGADLVEGVAHEACNNCVIIGGEVNGRGTDKANCAFVLEEDGGGLGDEGLEVDEVKCGCV